MTEQSTTEEMEERLINDLALILKSIAEQLYPSEQDSGMEGNTRL